MALNLEIGGLKTLYGPSSTMGASGGVAFCPPQSRGQRSLSSLKIQRGHWFMVPGRLEDGGFPDGEIVPLAALGMPQIDQHRLTSAFRYFQGFRCARSYPASGRSGSGISCWTSTRGSIHRCSIPLSVCVNCGSDSTFMDRFYVGRWKRWVFIEPLSEGQPSASAAWS
jgi:hypothetical protein